MLLFDRKFYDVKSIKESLTNTGMTISEKSGYTGNTRFFDGNGVGVKLPTNFSIFEN